MFQRRRSYWFVSSLLLCASPALAAEPSSSAAGAEPSASVVLVLDASSSMLGKIGKATKMSVDVEPAPARLVQVVASGAHSESERLANAQSELSRLPRSEIQTLV